MAEFLDAGLTARVRMRTESSLLIAQGQVTCSCQCADRHRMNLSRADGRAELKCHKLQVWWVPFRSGAAWEHENVAGLRLKPYTPSHSPAASTLPKQLSFVAVHW